MKKVQKIILTTLLFIFLILLFIFLYVMILVSNVKLDEDKLINLEKITTFYDINNEVFREESGGKSVCELSKIPNHTINAFIAIEDKRFFSHNGVDYKGLMRATLNNLKSFSFKEGASTISQQLIKNTHLSSEKTFKRKIIEMKLALELEKKFSKKEILEKYLNTIYFGNNCYGIKSASKFYFNKSPEELSINESAVLAGMIKAPSIYSPIKNPVKCNERKNVVLKEMYSQGYINKDEYNENFSCRISVNLDENYSSGTSYSFMVKKELSEILDCSPYLYDNVDVFTSFSPEVQNNLEKNLKDNQFSRDNAGVVIKSNGKICAYYSTCKNAKRQMGSAIKPILVYAPAIELNVVNSATKILDEKIDFSGYSPSNYNDKYYGYVSVQESLSKSLNSCAVKLLNYTGIEKALSYAKKTDIPFEENDNSLCLALGATANGASLEQLTGAYLCFLNSGSYIRPSFISEIKLKNGQTIYKNNQKYNKVFSEDTTSIVNEMLYDTVQNGTAKKLSFFNNKLYAKTGTVGTKNGNTDAYAISYNAEYVMGVWFGNADNSYMKNNVTGGGVPCTASLNIWNDIYLDKDFPSDIEKRDVKELYIDKLLYEKENKIVLADDACPERYKLKTIFKKNNVPKEKTTRFSYPTIDNYKISVINNQINIELCLTELVNANIYKEYNGKKELVFYANNSAKQKFVDNIEYGIKYNYYAVPYFDDGKNVYYGKEILLKQIKLNKHDNDFWRDDVVS